MMGMPFSVDGAGCLRRAGGAGYQGPGARGRQAGRAVAQRLPVPLAGRSGGPARTDGVGPFPMEFDDRPARGWTSRSLIAGPVQERGELPQLVHSVVHVGAIEREAVRRSAEGAEDQGEDGAWGLGGKPIRVRDEALEPVACLAAGARHSFNGPASCSRSWLPPHTATCAGRLGPGASVIGQPGRAEERQE